MRVFMMRVFGVCLYAPYTNARSICLSLSLCRPFQTCALNQAQFKIGTRTHARTRTHTLSHARAHARTHTHAFSLSRSLLRPPPPHACGHSLSLSLRFRALSVPRTGYTAVATAATLPQVIREGADLKTTPIPALDHQVVKKCYVILYHLRSYHIKCYILSWYAI